MKGVGRGGTGRKEGVRTERLRESRWHGRSAYLHLVFYFVRGLLELANLSDDVRYLRGGGEFEKTVCCLRPPPLRSTEGAPAAKPGVAS